MKEESNSEKKISSYPINLIIWDSLGSTAARLFGLIVFLSKNASWSCSAHDEFLCEQMHLGKSTVQENLKLLFDHGLIFRNTWTVPTGKEREIIPCIFYGPYQNKIEHENFRNKEVGARLTEHNLKHKWQKFFTPKELEDEKK